MSKWTYNTALVLIPPAEVWPPIQSIRQRYDRKFHRWMPHITFIYPFVPKDQFEHTANLLLPACRTVQPFEVELATFHTFHHGRGAYTMWLAPQPEQPLISLYTALLDALAGAGHAPRQPRNQFMAHLSVGQVNGREQMERLVGELQSAWQSIRFAVSEVSLIWRNDPPDDVFRVGHKVRLGDSEVNGTGRSVVETRN